MRKERRKFSRVRISVEVGGKHIDSPLIKVRSLDISLGGIHLLLPEKLPKDTVMELEINLPLPPVITRGKVVWIKETETKKGKFFQTGIEFTEIKQADKARIEAFIHSIDRLPKSFYHKYP